MNSTFSGQTLAEKLSKLNNSQQSIESLSQWCISHRKRARQIVETWDKIFNSSQRERRVSFLYLANDILQNSRRKGSEFVNEFWKYLPSALKNVYDNSDDAGKNAVSRLVDIWDERNVFGSRGRSLKDQMLGKDAPSLLENNAKSLNPIKIVKKDAHSIRIKLAVGGMPEKIVSALHSLHDEDFKEDAALNKCKAAAHHIEKMEKVVEKSSTHGYQQVSTVKNELNDQENILRQGIEQLENVIAARTSLICQLKELLQFQETKLENVQTQFQVAQGHIEQASILRQKLSSYPVDASSPFTTTVLSIETSVPEPSTHKFEAATTTTTMIQHPLTQPMTSYASQKTSIEDENKKATAAAVAAKLAAMTSSAQMLSSVLSSLAAEEAATSMNSGLKPVAFTPNLPVFPPEKKPRLEKPMPVSDTVSSTYFTHGLQPPLPNVPPISSQAANTSTQSNSHPVQMQHQFPPLPPVSQPPLPPVHSYPQSNNMMMNAMSYGFGANSLPPPPPLPTHMVMGLTRSGTQPQQQQPPPLPLQPQTQPQQQPLQAQNPQQQQQPGTGMYYQSPGIGFYGSHQQPTPSL